MNKSLVTLATAAVLGLGSTVASATPLTINNGIDWAFSPDGSTKTMEIENLGFTGSQATSIYFGNPAVAGTSVIDTNMLSTMTTYGFSAGSKTSLANTTINFSNPSAGSVNIDALNPLLTFAAESNGFSSGTVGSLGLWGLSYQYTIAGTTTANAVSYTSGYFNVFYENGGAPVQVLRLNLTGSTTTLSANEAALTLYGNISFDFDGNGTDDASAFAKSFWEDTGTNGQSFYTRWLADPEAIDWSLTTNVVPPLPTANQLWAAPSGALFRQASLNGQITFNVPEPATLALMGLALAGAGAVSRRRKQA